MTDNKKLLEMLRDVQKNPCVCFSLRKVSRAVSQVYAREIGPYSTFNGTQYTLASVIAAMQPVNFNDLALYTYSDKTTIARNLKVLEKSGLVKFSVGVDKRQKMVALTTKGEEALVKAYPHWQQTQQRIKDIMGKHKVDQLLEDLAMVLADVQKV